MANRQFTVDDLIVLHEDRHVIVVVKPANVPSQADESGDADMLTVVKQHLMKEYDKESVYCGLVHRLDRPTGGVMVFAKTSKAASRLAEQMRGGDFEKKYFAVLAGCPKEKKATLVNYLKKNPVNNMVYICPPTTDGAKMASLDYEVLEEEGGCSLVRVRLHTGRTHQIRVQMAGLGTPVYGDMRYGGENAKKGGLALWAYSLCFTHPVTKERMRFMAEPPQISPWKHFDIKKAFEL